ncbi:hypothetical protein NQ318_019435 [Aromia moschata]|uniref:Transposase n=1 Tax=Aromia moschata TaxID=1265417 RepID=A0AAV8XZD5_9CUCU|nr:hypothetical protein NQ318_019435 [Aromia moschata]
MSYLTESLKIEILVMIGYLGIGYRARTQCEVVRLFRETHPDLPPLNQGTISKIEAQYREMGHVRKVPSKRQAVVDDDTKLNLLLALEENPITPARQLARDSNLNHKTVLKILKYEKKRPYKMQAVQELLEDDPDRRVEFCDLLKLSYWAEENSHWMRELHTQRPQKTNVWAGIIQDRIVGPFFFDDTLNGARYLRLLQHELMPICALIQGEIADNINFSKYIMFTDEATFTSNGTISSQNCRWWADDNPNFIMEYTDQYSFKANVWCGISNGRLIGPYFFRQNLNAKGYLNFLQHEIAAISNEMFIWC